MRNRNEWIWTIVAGAITVLLIVLIFLPESGDRAAAEETIGTEQGTELPETSGLANETESQADGSTWGTDISREMREGTYVYDDGSSVYSTAIVSSDAAGLRIDIEAMGYGGHGQGMAGGYLNALGNNTYTCIDENDIGSLVLTLTADGFTVQTHPNAGMEPMLEGIAGTYVYTSSVTTMGDAEELPADGDFIFPESDTRYLTDGDTAGMTPDELRLGLNEIYARHGRIFQSEDLNAYFSAQPWYTPQYTAEEFAAIESSVLNEYERQNIQFLAALRDSAN